jgi:hypothetical protein
MVLGIHQFELKVIPIMAAPENKSYNSSNGGLRHLQDGQLTFGIYDAINRIKCRVKLW